MPRAMVFIDGSWLRESLPLLAREEADKLAEPGQEFNPKNYHVDYGLLIHRIKERLAASKELRIEPKEIDVVRTYIFGSLPINVDERDNFEVRGIEAHYDMLEKDFGYDAVTYQKDYRGKRLHLEDRIRDGDNSRIEEKRVDVGLASHMLYFAAIPYAYDVAIAIIGDEDYVPVLQRVRNLGRRVAIVSIHTRYNSPCARVYGAEYDDEEVRDFEVIWLNELARDIRMPERPITCEHPDHQGTTKRSLTTRRKIEGRPEYCDDCFESEARTRRSVRGLVNERLDTLRSKEWPGHGGLLCGIVSTIREGGDTGKFGFAMAWAREGETREHYFNGYYLAEPLTMDELKSGDEVAFRAEYNERLKKWQAKELRKTTARDWIR